MTARPIALMLALALVTACGGGDDAATTDTSSMAIAPADTMMGASATATPAAGGSTLVTDVETVVTQGEGQGLTAIPVATALPIIQRIEDQLDATDAEPLDEIATDLEKLREALGKSSVQGTEVAGILRGLGQKTTAVAGNAQVAGAAAPMLTRLGTLLTTSADKLGGR